KRRWLVPALGLAMGLVGALAMQRLESRYSVAAEQLASCAPQRVAYNYFAHPIAGSVDAGEYALLSGDKTPPGADSDALVLAPSAQSNRPGFDGGWDDSPPRIPGARCVRIGAYAIYDRSGKCELHGDACN